MIQAASVKEHVGPSYEVPYTSSVASHAAESSCIVPSDAVHAELQQDFMKE